MPLVLLTLSRFGVGSIGIIGENRNPQSMNELIENYRFDMPETPFTWEEYCTMRDKVYLEHGRREVRRLRDIELSQTDWIELPSNRETLANLDSWLEYRQALRDIPDSLTLSEISWEFNPGCSAKLIFSRFDNLKRPKVLRKPVAEPVAEPASQT